MKLNPQLLALFTAMAWGIGGYFEKKGLHLGGFSPQLGITIRTSVAFLILATVSFSEWKNLLTTENKMSIVMMVIGGGVVAGAIGMLCFYSALKGAASLNEVMPIAFTSPFFGAVIGLLMGTEKMTPQLGFGMLLTMAGIALVATAK